jgi:hypothetical protein
MVVMTVAQSDGLKVVQGHSQDGGIPDNEVALSGVEKDSPTVGVDAESEAVFGLQLATVNGVLHEDGHPDRVVARRVRIR